MPLTLRPPTRPTVFIQFGLRIEYWLLPYVNMVVDILQVAASMCSAQPASLAFLPTDPYLPCLAEPVACWSHSPRAGDPHGSYLPLLLGDLAQDGWQALFRGPEGLRVGA